MVGAALTASPPWDKLDERARHDLSTMASELYQQAPHSYAPEFAWRALTSVDSRVLANGVLALSHSYDEHTRARLREGLEHENPRTRRVFAAALAQGLMWQGSMGRGGSIDKFLDELRALPASAGAYELCAAVWPLVRAFCEYYEDMGRWDEALMQFDRITVGASDGIFQSDV